jgi:hypothetical protein
LEGSSQETWLAGKVSEHLVIEHHGPQRFIKTGDVEIVSVVYEGRVDGFENEGGTL